MGNSKTYVVAGMTCGGCAGKVSDQVEKLDAVEDIDVDLATGTLTLHTHAPLDDGDVHDAIERAGYKVVV